MPRARLSDLVHHGSGQGTGEMQTHNEAPDADQPEAGELPLAARRTAGPGGVLLWRAGDPGLPLLRRTSSARVRPRDAAQTKVQHERPSTDQTVWLTGSILNEKPRSAAQAGRGLLPQADTQHGLCGS